MRNEGEPSVEEILDSIKKVIARDSREITRSPTSATASPAYDDGQDAPLAPDYDAEPVPPAPPSVAPSSAPSGSMADAYAAHFTDDPSLEVAAPFTQDPYGDEGAVLDLSDIDFIDSAEDALAAHLQGAHQAPPTAASGYSSAFASVQNSLKAMGGAVYAPAASRAAPEADAVPSPQASPPSTDAALTGESSARSMRESLAALAKMAEPEESAHVPVPAHETSLEGLVRDMLRPMLARWLDENLPDVVERLVKAEIERILQKRG